MSSALLFGSAMDAATNFILENKDKPNTLKEAQELFLREWEQGQDVYRNKVDLPLNPNIKYFKADWDADLLEKKDWAELFKYDSKYFEMRERLEAALKDKKNWLDLPEEDRMHYNYGNWLCMRKKGQLLLTAFYEQIVPQIKEVIAVQLNVELDDGEGNIFNGVLDYVAKLHNDRIAIMDNKTTSTEYEEGSVEESEQLATYFAIMNIKAMDPEDSWKHKIDCAGYSVMSKKILKEKTCKECGFESTGSHKKCNNEIDGKRCNGEWTKKLSAKTQFITGNISQEFADTVLENASTVKSCIEMGLFPKNYSACADQFGQPCPFYNKCHGNSDKGLVKLEKKD